MRRLQSPHHPLILGPTLFRSNPFSLSSHPSSPGGQSTSTSNTPNSLLSAIPLNGSNTHSSLLVNTSGAFANSHSANAEWHNCIFSSSSEDMLPRTAHAAYQAPATLSLFDGEVVESKLGSV